jgi:hypothetical protein
VEMRSTRQSVGSIILDDLCMPQDCSTHKSFLFYSKHEVIYPKRLCARVFTLSAYARGKPTRFAPIPKPAPWRAVTPMLGEKMSSTANTAAAAMVTVRISSRGRLFRGINTSARATATPSTTYLMMRVKRSFMSILIYICPSDFLLE